MKNLVLFGFLSFSVFAEVSTYIEGKMIYFPGLSTQTVCEENQGIWNMDDHGYDYCEFESENSVRIKRDGHKVTGIAIETLGTNAHSCTLQVGMGDYPVEGEITQSENTINIVVEDVLKVFEDQEDYCEVTITQVQDDEVSVTTAGNCMEFCGTNASLDVISAVLE